MIQLQVIPIFLAEDLITIIKVQHVEGATAIAKTLGADVKLRSSWVAFFVTFS